MIYFKIFVISLVALFAVLLVKYRHVLPERVAQYLTPPESIRQFFASRTEGYTMLSSFSSQLSSGLSSSNFDIEANIADGDSRTGLDPQAAAEVQEIMRNQRVNFDQARLIRHNQHLARNGIDPTGMPIDSKAITRL